MTDILTVLYFDKMNVRPSEPKWEDRDRLVFLLKVMVPPLVYMVHWRKKAFSLKEELMKLL